MARCGLNFSAARPAAEGSEVTSARWGTAIPPSCGSQQVGPPYPVREVLPTMGGARVKKHRGAGPAASACGDLLPPLPVREADGWSMACPFERSAFPLTPRSVQYSGVGRERGWQGGCGAALRWAVEAACSSAHLECKQSRRVSVGSERYASLNSPSTSPPTPRHPAQVTLPAAQAPSQTPPFVHPTPLPCLAVRVPNKMGRMSIRWAVGAVALVSIAAMTAGEVGGDRAAPHGGEAATAVAVGGASGLVGQACRVTPWAAVGTVGAAPAVDAATAAVALLDEGADLRTAVRRQTRKVCGVGVG